MSIDIESMAHRYKNAESLLRCIFNLNKVPNSILFPNWIGASDIFWYERYSALGREYRIVDARAKTNSLAFDHAKLAAALAAASGNEIDADNLPIRNVSLQLDPIRLSFKAFKKSWIYKSDVGGLEEISVVSEAGVVSPDGKYAVFSKDYNLWVKRLDSGEERQLTLDGEEFFCYAVNGLAWGAPTTDPNKIQAIWSPDSKRVLTVQRDTRNVKALPVLHHVPNDGSVRPTVKHVKMAYPGDEHVEDYRIAVIDIRTGEVTAADHEKTPTIRNSGGFFSDNLGWWNENSNTAYFVHVDRYYKCAKLVEFDVVSGGTKTLFEETTETQIQLVDNADESPSLLPLPESNELVWYSNRSGWGHVYLYSTEDGALKRKITSGDWAVRDIVHYDKDRREIYLQTSSRQKGVHPQYRDLIKVHLDTGALTELATGGHTYFAARERSFIAHIAASFSAAPAGSNAVSPTGEFFVVTRSRLDEPPESILFDAGGAEVMTLESANLSRLPKDWRWPESVKVLSDDGKTEIFGCVYRPSNFSEDQSYPVLNQVFNTPELPWTPEGSFLCDGMFGYPFFVGSALAELGFIVVQFSGRGTTGRSKEFLDYSYGSFERASCLADHVAGIKQLAEKYPYMDTERVGIISDNGGPGGVQGLLDFPDFYQVGVAIMVHDSRIMSATMWGDKFEGPSGGEHYPEGKVDQLSGKLLLIHPMLDATSPPAGAFRIIEALKNANKNFDMLMLPCLGHDISNYTTRRSWDYLVTHLLGAKPPHEYPLKAYHWSD